MLLGVLMKFCVSLFCVPRHVDGLNDLLDRLPSFDRRLVQKKGQFGASCLRHLEFRGLEASQRICNISACLLCFYLELKMLRTTVPALNCPPSTNQSVHRGRSRRRTVTRIWYTLRLFPNVAAACSSGQAQSFQYLSAASALSSSTLSLSLFCALCSCITRTK